MRFLKVLLAAVILGLSIGPRVFAEIPPKSPPSDPAPSGGSDETSGTIASGVGESATPSDEDGDSSPVTGPSHCVWTDPFEQVGGNRALDPKLIDGILYVARMRICPGEMPLIHWLAQVTPGELAANTWDHKIESVPKPTFGSAPPSHNAIVKFDMWMWAEPAEFAPVTAHASVRTLAGDVTSTVTAVPLRLVFDPGEPDSEPMVCAGPGQPWLPVYGDQSDSACMYAYRHSSSIDPSGTFTARWSIVWRVTWTSSTGAGGILDDSFVTTTEQPMTVKEVQALVTG